MTRANILPPNPKLDLVLTRVVDVPRDLVWRAWTVPEHLMPWFAPKPWTATDCEDRSSSGRNLPLRDARAGGEGLLR